MKTKKLVLTALFLALSFVGANIKILGSIAMDSMAAFLGGLILGPVYGGIIAAVGHFLTAMTSGFPFGLPIHIITMFSMFLAVFVAVKLQNAVSTKFGKIAGVLIGTITAVIINGPVALALISPIMGKAAFALIPVLCMASVANVAVAQVIFTALPSSIKEKL